MFAQASDPVPPGPEVAPYQPSLLELIFSGLCPSVFAFLALVLKIWMAVECLRKDPDRYIWVWIIIFVPFGSLIYFFLRWLPSNEIRLPRSLQRYTRGRELDRLRLAARQIGNAHQHIQLGDALRDLGQYDEAGSAYEDALEKEPENLQALWGAAQVDLQFGEYGSACQRLKKILQIDSQYKFGDVSLEYGKALRELEEIEAAIEHFEQHVRRWPQPEAMYQLASLHAEEGNYREARSHLQSMMLDINSSPRGIARRFAIWRSRGRRLLRRLPRDGPPRR